MKLMDTYNRLRNGEKEYLEIMDNIIEYRMTNGRCKDEVKIYLDQKSMITRYAIYIGLCVSLAIGTALVCSIYDVYSISLILSAIPSMILIYAGIYYYGLQKYKKKSEKYIDVNDYVNTIDPQLIIREYRKHHNHKDER